VAQPFYLDDMLVIEKGIPIYEKKEFHSIIDGVTQWISTTKVPWKDETGKIIGLVGFGADVTKKVIAEEKIKVLSEAIKQSPISIIITNRAGIIEYVNPGFEKMTGYYLDYVKGKTARILKQENTDQEVYYGIWATILSGKKWEGEYIGKRKTGDTYWESVIIAPIFDDRHTITNFIIITEDITERKELINELIKTKEKAVESDQLKSAFLANMSHEIRTPMNGILGFTELLKIPELNPADQQHYLTMIEQSGERLLNLINDIIDISKIEAGQIVFSFQKTNLNEMLEMEYQFFVSEAEKKGLQLSFFKSLPNEEAYIETDPLRLRQVLTNLIKNSIKFTQKGKIEFGYKVTSNFIEFSVSDQGIGISEEMQKKIFERFNQGDLVSKRRYEGAGLGLSISKAIIEMLGGSIWAETPEEKGSLFKFTIPRIQENKDSLFHYKSK
jgi:PAS domain S-box-containing protein